MCFTSDPTLADTWLDPVFALTGSAAESVLLPALACLCIPVALFLGHCCGRGYAHVTFLDTRVQITLRTGFSFFMQVVLTTPADDDGN